MALEDLHRITVTSRAEWRAWLEEHHAQANSIWLVTYKKRAGLPHVTYAGVVEEALCFGWIDGRPAKLDAERSMLLVSPRRSGSAWSAVNKERVAQLTVRGLMAPAGLAAVDRAKADGSWEALREVDTLAIPPDLAAALRGMPRAARFFEAFPPSSRRGILEWIGSAKRPETRAKRVAETATLAAQNIKANFPAGRNAGPKPRL